MRNTIIILGLALSVSGCSILRPRTIVDVADALCSTFFSEKMAISIEDAAKAFCDTEEKVKPFLDEVLAARKQVEQDERVQLKLKLKAAGRAP